MNGLNRIILAASLILLSACSIHSSQLTALISMVKAPVTELSKSAWSLSYGDYQSTVYAVAVSGATLFSNSQGDQVLFDGWNVKDVRGVGFLNSHWQIIDSGESRALNRYGKLTAVHSCSAWRNLRGAPIIAEVRNLAGTSGVTESGKTVFSQTCQGMEAYINRIQVNAMGEIELISQLIDISGTPLLITKVL